MPDNIKFGTPTRAHLYYINKTSLCDKLFAQLAAIPFPLSSSKATREELNALVQWSDSLDNEALERYLAYDEDVYAIFRDLSPEGERGEAYRATLDSLFEDLMPIVYKLKYSYNRPRPRQLAAHYKLKLFPHPGKSVDSPAYPSGHALVARVVSQTLGSLYPRLYGPLKMLSRDIAHSRQFMGHNYPSDVDAALIGADAILNDHEFKLKYRL